MTCFHPITAWKNTVAHLDIPAKDYYALKKVSFKPVKGRQKIEIPCGHCIGCKLDKASDWATRCHLETKNWDNNCFITLTYNQNHLPISHKGLATLKLRDLQTFFKRLRYHEKGKQGWININNLEHEFPIRYFACGEYGPTHGRPHYHAIIFNWKPKDLKFYKNNKHGDPMYTSKSLQSIWGKGFVIIEDVNFHTAGYVAQYTLKKAGAPTKKREYTGEIHFIERIDERNGKKFMFAANTIKKEKKDKEDEFIVMSRAVGIGRLYWEENKEKVKRNSGVFIKLDTVVWRPVPKYFKKIWEKEDYEEFYRWQHKQQKKGEENQKKMLSKYSLPGLSDDEKLDWINKLKEKTLKSRLSGNQKRQEL